MSHIHSKHKHGQEEWNIQNGSGYFLLDCSRLTTTTTAVAAITAVAIINLIKQSVTSCGHHIKLLQGQTLISLNDLSLFNSFAQINVSTCLTRSVIRSVPKKCVAGRHKNISRHILSYDFFVADTMTPCDTYRERERKRVHSTLSLSLSHSLFVYLKSHCCELKCGCTALQYGCVL